MSLRKVVSLFLLVGFLFLLLTSVMLYIVPQGRVAYWSGWTLWGFSKTAWTEFHINLGLFLVIAAGLHIYYNWKPIVAYLKTRTRRLVVLTTEFTLASLIVLAILVGTQFHLPPLSWVLDLNESIKDAAGESYGEPPYGHAELSTLETFVRRVDLDLTDVLEKLRAAGIGVEGPKSTMEEIAAANGITPQQLYAVMQPPADEGDVPESAGLPKIPPPGTGRKQLGDFCAEYGLDPSLILQLLEAHGMQATSAETLRDIAQRGQTTTGELYELIRLSKDGATQ